MSESGSHGGVTGEGGASGKEIRMRTLLPVCIVAVVLMCPCGGVSADSSLAERVQTSCREELQSHCSSVMPGQGRVLACLYVHGDQLSEECERALDEVAKLLEDSALAVQFVAGECEHDIKTHCGSVTPGDGRVLACLERNEEQVSSRCIGALEEVGLR